MSLKEDAFTFIMKLNWKLSNEAFFEAVAKFVHEKLGVKYVMINHTLSNSLAQTVAFIVNGEEQENVIYELNGTPCENIISGDYCFYPKHIQKLFPKDTMLVDMDAESYAGIPLWGVNKNALGLIAILDDKPLSNKNEIEEFLTILSFRLGSVLEKHLDEDTITKSQTELRQLAIAVDQHSIVSSTDLKGTIIRANDKFCEISGYSRDELVGENHNIIKSDHHSPAFFKKLWATIAKGKIWKGEIKNKKKDGSHYWVHSTIVPQLDVNGKPHEYLSIRTDVTQQKKSELTAIKNQDIAENALKVKSEFLRSMSHNLRTPLNAIIGYSESLQLGLFGDLGSDKNKEYVKDINISGNYLLNMVSDLLSFSEIEEGNLSVKYESIDLKDIVQECFSITGMLAKEKNQTFNIDIPPDLPNIRADKKMLLHILVNLSANSIKYTPEGGSISFKAFTHDGCHVMELKDTGIGIPKESLKIITEPFTRMEENPLVSSSEGTGLGLAIVKNLTYLHKGDLNIDSVVGEGTTVTVTIPS